MAFIMHTALNVHMFVAFHKKSIRKGNLEKDIADHDFKSHITLKFEKNNIKRSYEILEYF